MSRAAHTDDLAPVAAGRASTYPATATGPTRSAPLADGDTTLGRVWTDDHAAAGFLPVADVPPAQAALAARVVFRTLANLHRRAVPASQVLEPGRWAPMYQLGDAASD